MEVKESYNIRHHKVNKNVLGLPKQSPKQFEGEFQKAQAFHETPGKLERSSKCVMRFEGS